MPECPVSCRDLPKWVFVGDIGYFFSIAVSATGTENDFARAAEVSKSGNGSGFALQVWPEGAFDLNSLTYSTTNPIFSRSTPNFTAPRELPFTKDKFDIDFKTDHEVDIKKFMPIDTQQRMLLETTTPLNGTTPAKKSIPFLGLSVTKSLN